MIWIWFGWNFVFYLVSNSFIKKRKKIWEIREREERIEWIHKMDTHARNRTLMRARGSPKLSKQFQAQTNFVHN